MVSKEATREKLIYAAKEEFKETGYKGAKVNSIAKRAGIQPSLFYYHFKNLEDIVLFLYKEMQNQIIHILLDMNITDTVVFLFAVHLCQQRVECCIKEHRRFAYETTVNIPDLTQKLNQNLEQLWLPYYDSINRQYQISGNSDYITRTIANAGERQLMINMYENPLKSTLSREDWQEYADNKVYYCHTLFLRYGAVDSKVIDEKFSQAKKIADQIDIDSIHFL